MQLREVVLVGRVPVPEVGLPSFLQANSGPKLKGLQELLSL